MYSPVAARNAKMDPSGMIYGLDKLQKENKLSFQQLFVIEFSSIKKYRYGAPKNLPEPYPNVCATLRSRWRLPFRLLG